MHPLTHPVSNGLAVEVDLLVQQLKEARGEELEVLDVGLFGRARSLWRLGLTDSQRLPEVGVHSVVGFALALGGFDPAPQGAEFLFLTVVLSLELVHRVLRVHGERAEAGLSQRIQLLLQFIRLHMGTEK